MAAQRLDVDAGPMEHGRSSGAGRLLRRFGGSGCGPLCLGATATDTGGSIRQPAAFTGIVGIKPTYGRCSRWGIVAFASSLDQAGPLAKTVRDAAILMRSMSGHDARIPPRQTCQCRTEAAVGKSVKGMRIGIPKEYRVDGMPDEIEKLWAQGRRVAEGGRRRDRRGVAAAHEYALPTYYIVAPAEASSNLARYDGIRYGPRTRGANRRMYEKTRARVWRRGAPAIIIGTYVLSAGYYDAYYLRAQKVRTLIKQDFEQALPKACDAILTPRRRLRRSASARRAKPIRSRCI